MVNLKKYDLIDSTTYNNYKVATKKIVNILCLLFAVILVLSAIASLIMSMYCNYLFLYLYISFVFCSFTAVFIYVSIILSSYFYKDSILDGGKYKLTIPHAVIAILLLIGISVYALIIFIITLPYCLSAWNLPKPLLICIFSFVMLVFNLIVIGVCIMWLVKWRLSWDELCYKKQFILKGKEIATALANEDILTEKLSHLKKLHEDNLISKEEYETMRIELLKKYVQK